MTEPITMTANGFARSTCVSTAKPTVMMTSPTHISAAGGNRRASIGTIIEPATNDTNDGSDHKPAWSGESPRTSCRYWAMKTNDPKKAKVPIMYVASADVNVRDLNSWSSISG